MFGTFWQYRLQISKIDQSICVKSLTLRARTHTNTSKNEWYFETRNKNRNSRNDSLRSFKAVIISVSYFSKYYPYSQEIVENLLLERIIFY